jgi:hypothetical protein
MADMPNLKQALTDPSSVYKEPKDILLDNKLSRGQKIQILKRWGSDILEVQVAEEENMQGITRVDYQSVLKALKTLRAKIDLEHTPPTKQGG